MAFRINQHWLALCWCTSHRNFHFAGFFLRVLGKYCRIKQDHRIFQAPQEKWINLDYRIWKGVNRRENFLTGHSMTIHFHALEKEMATHSSVFAWRVPGTGEPGGLPSMGSHRVGHNWGDSAAAAAAVCVCHCYSLSLFHLFLPHPRSQVHSLHLCLYSCPANRFISNIFLDFIYVC